MSEPDATGARGSKVLRQLDAVRPRLRVDGCRLPDRTTALRFDMPPHALFITRLAVQPFTPSLHRLFIFTYHSFHYF